jgi:regulator of protease activity HflC (stomatin/prohibitin superfamily)
VQIALLKKACMDALAQSNLPTLDTNDTPSANQNPGILPKVLNTLSALRLFLLLIGLALVSQFFVIVPAGHQGVLLRFGAVQEKVLSEGLHPVLPVRDSVRPMTLRIQSQQFHSEAASRDLQDVEFDVAISWHLEPNQVPRIYQRLGDETKIVSTVIEPALEDGLKAVVAHFRAEELITDRDHVKESLFQLLFERLKIHNIGLNSVDLLQVDFSKQFRLAVEAKQVAEQDAKRAAYDADKARRLAEAKVFLADGQARAQQLLQTSLTPEVLEHEAIEKWNGHLPLVMDHQNLAIDIKSLLKADNKIKEPERRR